jgi:phenylacetate-CoA ligase
MPAYIRELERFQPVMISGYPSSLYPLALAFQKYAVAGLSVRAIYSTSETLFNSQRQVLEEAFGCKVFNAYGNSEMCGNIFECEAGELHLRSEHSHIEILREDGVQCGPGETGRLVCTNFSNRAFPLIRYDIGDIVIVSKDQTSKCGRGGVLIDNIVGRLEDCVVSPVMGDN